MPTVDRVLSDETDETGTAAEPPAPARTEPSEGAPKVSVIVPALNEARNLPHVFARLPQVDELVLVDGGSTDDTVAVARRLRPDIRVVRQNRRGKGNALACGFAAATGDIIVMIDADGSTDPLEIPSFVETLLNLRAARADLKITEVASFEHNRIHGVSNLNAFTDGLRVLRTIAREWRPRRRTAMTSRNEARVG